MRIYIFNPEHDMSLASGLVNFTPPRAGRLLRHDLSFLPAVWAKQDDAVLVDEVDYAWEQYKSTGLSKQCNFIACNDLSRMASVGMGLEFEPWGWDLPVREQLVKCNVSTSSLPDNDYLNTIKRMSHRGWSATNLLPELTKTRNTIGEAKICHNWEELKRFLSTYHRIVVKSPWSCSGRGVRYIEDNMPKQLEGWFNNVIKQQGCVLMEPYYNKPKRKSWQGTFH